MGVNVFFFRLRLSSSIITVSGFRQYTTLSSIIDRLRFTDIRSDTVYHPSYMGHLSFLGLSSSLCIKVDHRPTVPQHLSFSVIRVRTLTNLGFYVKRLEPEVSMRVHSSSTYSPSPGDVSVGPIEK